MPTPLRALLWWPAISFVLVIVAPEAAVGTIIAAGALLAVIGGLASAVARRLRALRAQAVPAAPLAAPLAAPTGDRPYLDPSTVEIGPAATNAA